MHKVYIYVLRICKAELGHHDQEFLGSYRPQSRPNRNKIAARLTHINPWNLRPIYQTLAIGPIIMYTVAWLFSISVRVGERTAFDGELVKSPRF
jgi:hypothetical protein